MTINSQSSSIPLPAVALAAVPGRRTATLELGREIEARGFAGIYCASFGDAMGLSQGLAQVTNEITIGTSIANLYMRHVSDYAQTAAMIHEISNGRFRFGIGVSHGAMHRRAGIEAGQPLSDMREFIANLRKVSRIGDLPPIVVAGLRTKMVSLASELAEGVVFANASRSHFPTSISVLTEEQRNGDDFFIGNMIPT
ncbi:MAG: LLM class flavin-dependent oxidoreductase, partial [Myxococcota bacterium]